MGRFEEALVFYHMGGKQRPDMELFQQGVRKAQEAIEVSLGGTITLFTPHKSLRIAAFITHYCTLSMFACLMQWNRLLSSNSCSRGPRRRRRGSRRWIWIDPSTGLADLPSKETRRSFSANCTLISSTLKSWFKTQVIYPLYVFVYYIVRCFVMLLKGLHNPILPSQKIIHHARETLDYLRARENFWRQQQPANLFYLPPVEKPKLKTVSFPHF